MFPPPPPSFPAHPGRRSGDEHADRIRSLGDEVDRLRRCHDGVDDRVQGMVLKLAEIQLNLAVQDKTLGKLDAAVNGNGRPGLAGRVESVERVTGGLTRSVWMLAAAAVAAAAKLVTERLR